MHGGVGLPHPPRTRLLIKNERKMIMARTSRRAVSTPAAEDTKIQEAVTQAPAAQTDDTRAVYKVKESPALAPTDFITVRNGFDGKLIYKSKRTGEKYVWQDFGDEQDIELAELKNAKNSCKKFFENNWFMFDNMDVIAYLGVERLYKNALDIDHFDEIFSLPPDKAKERIALLSDGQKCSVKYRARKLIQDGVIDSIKMINALEEALCTELIER